MNDKSQSIASDRISESTIARTAGNILSGEWPKTSSAERWSEESAVKRAVRLARMVAAEVKRTAEHNG